MSHTYFWEVTQLEECDQDALQTFIGYTIIEDNRCITTGMAECCHTQRKILFYQLDKEMSKNQIESIDKCMSSM
mgnify:CR=1 FL=1|tara:strand:+ start:289 stop:510 length:222 start_codon:yes stop_codon:yes gene_type:complete